MTNPQQPITGQDAPDGGAERPAYAVGQVWMTRAAGPVVITRISPNTVEAQSVPGGFRFPVCKMTDKYITIRPPVYDLTTFIAPSISDLASIAKEGRPEDRERIAELEGENARLREALIAIEIYCHDTATGPTESDNRTYEWAMDAVEVARDRARAALSSGEA